MDNTDRTTWHPERNIVRIDDMNAVADGRGETDATLDSAVAV